MNPWRTHARDLASYLYNVQNEVGRFEDDEATPEQMAAIIRAIRSIVNEGIGEYELVSDVLDRTELEERAELDESVKRQRCVKCG